MADHKIKFGYYASTEIQQKVTEQKLDQYDFVTASDTNELYYITSDLKVQAFQYRPYQFADEATAVSLLNTMGDTYDGQIVGIKTGNNYHAYLVNKDATTGKFKVTDMAEGGDYDNLSNVPITNKVGTLADPIILDTLADGTYRISGAYSFTSGSTIVFPSGYEFFLIYGSDIAHITPKNMSRLTYDTATASIVEDPYITAGDVMNYGKATSAEVAAIFK